MVIEQFSLWMKHTTNLSDASISHYASAINAISKDMMLISVISKPINEMGLSELDISIPIILNNPEFVEKNNRGNQMYSNGLKHFRSFKTSFDESESDSDIIVNQIMNANNISVTEKESLIKSRVGQGKFRETLMNKYNGSCVITGINIPTLLIASHIRPWAVSNNFERLSSDNGILLSATYDRLFDSGLITFKDSGLILVSKYVDDNNKSKLNLSNGSYVDVSFSTETKHHLEYHRDVVFLKKLADVGEDIRRQANETLRSVQTKTTQQKTFTDAPVPGRLCWYKKNLFRRRTPPTRWIAAVSAAEVKTHAELRSRGGCSRRFKNFAVFAFFAA
ncbi:MAG: HNH endonuclease [Thermoguttaceae bacterium]|nr:HNH endonuclease [Thermoguttaceae bacterium]